MSGVLKKILVVRNDRLGDLMLAFPTFQLLKRALPATEVHALVPAYTAEMAEACTAVDHCVLDVQPHASIADHWRLTRLLRAQRYDAALVLFSTTRIGWYLLMAGIGYRLAPATKVAQLLHNRRMRQRRSRSTRPEFQYNLELGERLLRDFDVPVPSVPQPPFLQYPAAEIAALRAAFCQRHGIDGQRQLVFLHPGSGGSASNLSLLQYADLARRLAEGGASHWLIISAGPGERDIAARLASLLGELPHSVYVSEAGLRRFSQHLQCADVFISGSTGPLHIAGALNRPTAAFYPRRRSSTALRWQTLNADERRLAFPVPEHAPESDMASIDIAAAAREIRRRFLVR